MACERWREMLSAQLDGEDDPALRPLVDEHLAGCAGCRDWLDRAAVVNRLTRTAPVPPVPDLSAAILAALPQRAAPPRRRRLPVAALLYIALALVGTVQLILGLTQVGGGASAAHAHTGLSATPGHLWHESAAWNVAVGAGYLFIALRRTRPTGLVPMLTAFVAMLLLLSVNDLTGGRVDIARLVGHGFVIAGYLLVVALSRGVGGAGQPPGARAGSGWRFESPADEDAPRPGLRLLPSPRGPLTARHRDDRRAA
ncbi:zf-HC2 domain-containing protein [Actinoplanes hulinensis]|uniref:Zf-HC2 domain-containing protein n=1 Tax=Actinoplanes hulinensis TaxID=1144547 RepID=A0ABS7B9S7_9ACTN|nr:zf-HC2 domain-containing protein [Actinoplanes hulinensis]MBW6437803.1 zf-HC2 domain-containing protein [Actinoplanes hulinensis]